MIPASGGAKSRAQASAARERLDESLRTTLIPAALAVLTLALGAKAVGVGRYYLFPLAAAGQPGVERALEQMREELLRDMRLMGCRNVGELTRDKLRFR